MTKTATIEAPTRAPTIAASFNLDDPNEARIQNAIQVFYTDCDRLHAIRQGTAKSLRMVWTLGSFHSDDPRARVEWSVLHWTIDEISVRIQRCKDEAEARAAFQTAGQPDRQLPGIKLPNR